MSTEKKDYKSLLLLGGAKMLKSIGYVNCEY